MIRNLRISLPPARSADAIVVDVGDRLCVELHARPGTGYGWAATVSDPAMLREIPCPDAAAPAVEPGGEEPQRFCYEVARDGQAAVDLAYLRPWQADAPRHRVAVRVTAR